MVFCMTVTDPRSHRAATLKVASIQYRAVPAVTAENISRLSELVSQAAAHGAVMIVLPELCTTGLNIHIGAGPGSLAETIPGPATDAFAALAQRYGVHIVLGLAEADPASGKLYNAQAVIGPDGSILGKYRKIHLFGPDLEWAETGDLGYLAVDTEWGRVGLGICCDINYWEYIDFLSASRVDMIAFSSNWVGDEPPFPYWSGMVAGGGYYVIAANNWGEEGGIRFSGGSAILSPDLSLLAQSGPSADTILYAEINPPAAGR
jgi:predicted amidohydrolase